MTRLTETLIRRTKAAGGHFFDRDTMRHFGSQLHDVYRATDDRFIFVTSEKVDPFEPASVVAYTVREATFRQKDSRVYETGGEISDVGEAPDHTYQEYIDKSEASRAARDLATSIRSATK